MLNKKFLSFMCIVLCLGLVACTASPAPLPATTAATTDPIETIEPVELVVYYLESDPNSSQIVTAFDSSESAYTVDAVGFSSVDEIDAAIASVLDTDDAPDVILFPNSTKLDTFKLAAEGAFLNLSSWLDWDMVYSSGDYYPLFNCGQIAGEQLLIPLRFQLLHYITSTEKIESTDLTLPEYYTASELMSALISNAETRSDYESALQLLSPNSPGGLLYDHLRLSGIDISTPDNQARVLQDDIFEEYAHYLQTAIEEILTSEMILKAYQTDFKSAVSRLTTMLSTDSLAYNMRYYDALFSQCLEESVQILPLTDYQIPNNLTVDVSVYAAVSANTNHPEEAYQFIRYAMDAAIGVFDNDLSICKASVASLLDDLSHSEGETINTGEHKVTVNKMSDDIRTDCENLLNRIAAGSIKNSAVKTIFDSTMNDYLYGKASYSDSYSALCNQLDQYLQYPDINEH